MSSELKFKRWFVAAWDGWLVRIEPGVGGDVGVSDLMVPVDGRLIPVELKLWLGDGRVSDIRGSQKVWHRQAAGEGLVTLLAAGEQVGAGRWVAWVSVWGSEWRWYRWERDGLRAGVTRMVQDETSRRILLKQGMGEAQAAGSEDGGLAV